MNIWVIVPLVSSVAHTALLVFVLLQPRKRVHNVFTVYLAVAAMWSFTSFMLHLNAFPEQAIIWNEILVVYLTWTVLTYYHFIRAYNNKPGGIGLYLGYVVILSLLVLSLNGYVVESAYVVDGILYHELGVWLYLIGAINLVIVVAVIFQLVQRYRNTIDPADRNRTIYLMTGWGILVLYGYTNLVPGAKGLSLDHIGNLANALIIAYAIRKYHLLDIKLVARKGLVYSSLTVSLTALYLLLLFTLQTFFQGLTGYSGLALAAALALLIAVLFNPLRNFIQKWIDRIFYRDTYDYRRMLLTFSGKISNVLDLGELAQSILDPVVKAMHAKQAALLFPNTESGDFTPQFGQQATKEEPSIKLRLTNDNVIVNWFATQGKALRRELIDTIPELKGLWETERVTLETAGVELLCPIRSKGNLIGILAVGKKLSDSLYSDEEADLLMTMANEAAVAIENARMLDSLKDQQLRVSQLLAQTVHAQEEERKRISADLHDSVAQWLAAASYRAQTCNALLSGHNNDEAQSELSAMESTIDKSLKELRRVVVGLRPPALDELGLNHALQQSLEDLKTDGLDCQFKITGRPVRLPSSVEIAVYRLVQEALTNVRKHAEATKVNLRLQFQEDKLLVEVRDNGKGFDRAQRPDSAISGNHMGLLGMKQRAETLGGDIRIKTGEGTGTTIIFSFPIQPQIEEG